jgi:hypothetical protein
MRLRRRRRSSSTLHRRQRPPLQAGDSCHGHYEPCRTKTPHFQHTSARLRMNSLPEQAFSCYKLKGSVPPGKTSHVRARAICKSAGKSDPTNIAIPRYRALRGEGLPRSLLTAWSYVRFVVAPLLRHRHSLSNSGPDPFIARGPLDERFLTPLGMFQTLVLFLC